MLTVDVALIVDSTSRGHGGTADACICTLATGDTLPATVLRRGKLPPALRSEARMADTCAHMKGIRTVTPSALGCEECLKSGSVWVHLRLCRTCGHVGCCDSSPNRHATKHFHATQHPIIEGYDPPEGWG